MFFSSCALNESGPPCIALCLGIMPVQSVIWPWVILVCRFIVNEARWWASLASCRVVWAFSCHLKNYERIKMKKWLTLIDEQTIYHIFIAIIWRIPLTQLNSQIKCRFELHAASCISPCCVFLLFIQYLGTLLNLISMSVPLSRGSPSESQDRVSKQSSLVHFSNLGFTNPTHLPAWENSLREQWKYLLLVWT